MSKPKKLSINELMQQKPVKRKRGRPRKEKKKPNG